MARMPRDYAAEYARRQARARSLGYKGYYQRRTAGAEGEEKRSKAGHRGYRDLLRYLKANGEGAVVGIDAGASIRSADGSWRIVHITVLGADGTERTFRVQGRNLDDARIGELSAVIHDAGAVSSPNYPVDLLSDDDEEPDEGDDDDEDEESEEEEFERLFGPAA